MKKRKFKVGDKEKVAKDLEDMGISNSEFAGKVMTINRFTGYERGDNRDWYELKEEKDYEFREDKLTSVRPAKFKTYKIEIIISTDEKIDKDILDGCWLNDESFSGSYKIKIKKIKNKGTKTN